MRIILVITALFFAAACTQKQPELKSPCVGLEDSPCGKRIPANEHWLGDARDSFGLYV